MATSVDQLIEEASARRGLPAPVDRREIRELAGVSLRGMAGAIGVCHATLVGWEKGAVPRNPGHLRTYARVLIELSRLPNGGASP